MFTYFSCRQFFKMIFTNIYFFNQRFQNCINNKWCLTIFLALTKLYLSVIRGHWNTTKTFIFTYFFVWLKFVICSKRMAKIQTKIPIIFITLLLLIMQIVFYCKIIPFLYHLKSLHKWFVFHDLSCDLKCSKAHICIFNI